MAIDTRREHTTAPLAADVRARRPIAECAESGRSGDRAATARVDLPHAGFIPEQARNCSRAQLPSVADSWTVQCRSIGTARSRSFRSKHCGGAPLEVMRPHSDRGSAQPPMGRDEPAGQTRRRSNQSGLTGGDQLLHAGVVPRWIVIALYISIIVALALIVRLEFRRAVKHRRLRHSPLDR